MVHQITMEQMAYLDTEKQRKAPSKNKDRHPKCYIQINVVCWILQV